VKRSRPSRRSLEEILKDHIQTLATTLQPQTILAYGSALNHLLIYLRTAFPQVRRLSQLRRDPHLLGWFRCLCAQDDPPLSPATRRRYLIQLRRLFLDLADSGYSVQSGLILSADLPPRQHYLPRPLSPEDDQLLQQELRRTDDLYSNALLLIRLTGIRLGECIHLALDCLRPLGNDQWALHVPLGKLHTERLVPVDDDVRHIMSRILTLRAQAPASQLAKSPGYLLPRAGGFWSLFLALRYAAIHAAERAGCSQRVTPHRLRHCFATEMLRLGIRLPALMQLMGHKDIQMTLWYLEVTQQDLQREFHLARQNTARLHLVPKFSLADSSLFTSPDLPGICRMLAATRHLLEMYRRQLPDEKTRRELQRLDKRLLTVTSELNQLITPKK
jgi:site-specific recombinase XerD